MNKIFNASDTELTEGLFNDGVIGKGDSLTVNLSETSLVDELRDGVSGGITESDEGKDSLDHVQRSLVNSEESTVVELSESE
ncbi:hypothetical protein FGF86_23460 [Salmonella sp. zj-f77]|nr:hypothetical protein [Salmonella sp. zj-f77]